MELLSVTENTTAIVVYERFGLENVPNELLFPTL